MRLIGNGFGINWVKENCIVVDEVVGAENDVELPLGTGLNATFWLCCSDIDGNFWETHANAGILLATSVNKLLATDEEEGCNFESYGDCLNVLRGTVTCFFLTLS